jgi:hypothetical protein
VLAAAQLELTCTRLLLMFPCAAVRLGM